MPTSGWIAVGIAFLVLEGSIFAAWMNLRDRVTRNEEAVDGLGRLMSAKLSPIADALKNLKTECDDIREKSGANEAVIGVHDQRLRSAESRLRRLEG